MLESVTNAFETLAELRKFLYCADRKQFDRFAMHCLASSIEYNLSQISENFESSRIKNETHPYAGTTDLAATMIDIGAEDEEIGLTFLFSRLNR